MNKKLFTLIIFVPIAIAILVFAYRMSGDDQGRMKIGKDGIEIEIKNQGSSVVESENITKAPKAKSSNVPRIETEKPPTGVPRGSPASIPIQGIHKNVVTVKGIGILDMNIKNVVQRIYLGKRAARADAKRQIIEVFATTVKGSTNTQSGILSKEETSITVASVLRFATVVSEKDLGDGTIEVIMKAPLNHK